MENNKDADSPHNNRTVVPCHYSIHCFQRHPCFNLYRRQIYFCDTCTIPLVLLHGTLQHNVLHDMVAFCVTA